MNTSDHFQTMIAGYKFTRPDSLVGCARELVCDLVAGVLSRFGRSVNPDIPSLDTRSSTWSLVMLHHNGIRYAPVDCKKQSHFLLMVLSVKWHRKWRGISTEWASVLHMTIGDDVSKSSKQVLSWLKRLNDFQVSFGIYYADFIGLRFAINLNKSMPFDHFNT